LARFPEGYAQIKAEIEKVRSSLNRDLNSAYIACCSLLLNGLLSILRKRS